MSLLWLLILPLLAVAGIAFKLASPKRLALMAATLNLILSGWLLCQYSVEQGGFQWELNCPWVDWSGILRINFHLGVDGISLPMVVLTALVTLAAVAVSPSEIKRAREFFICLLLISLGAMGAFLSRDLFFLYIFHEFALIPTFLLVGIWGGVNRQYASMQMTLYLALGSLILLAGLVGLVMSLPHDHRSFDLAVLQEVLPQENLSRFIFPLLFIGFGILVSLVPFHTWAPSGYAAAPPAVAMMHAGVLKKFGLYGLLRFAMPLMDSGPFTTEQYQRGASRILQFFGGCEWVKDFLSIAAPWGTQWEPWVVSLAVANILYIGMVTLAQKELPLMLGYSSVMHMGYLFLGLTAINLIGYTGVVVLMVGHGLSAALLFGLAGEIQHRTGETRMDRLGGIASRAPFLAVTFLVASMASIGLPGLANFVGESMIFFGVFRSHPYAAIVAVWGVVISAVYQLRAVRSVLFGELTEAGAKITDLKTWGSRAPYLLLLAASLVVGFAPQVLIRVIQPSVEHLLVGGR
jgi:NADH-quinone oxidoreductase subunit M